MLPKSTQLHASARESLRNAGPAGRSFALTYAGILTGLSAVLTLASYLLSHQVAGTGGLQNLGMRSILQTVQQTLPIAQTLLLLGLEYGYLSGILAVSRGKTPGLQDLKQGFFRFGGVFAFTMLQALLYVGVMLLCFFVTFRIYLLTPLAKPLFALLEPYLESPVLTAMEPLDPELANAVMGATVPMLILFVLASLALMIPISYSLSMTRFLLMDSDRLPSTVAMGKSRKMMKGNKFAMLKLDLSLWWYYLLSFLLTALCYGDILLPMLGVELPIHADAAYFLFYALYLLGQFALLYFALNYVTLVYAKAYEALKPKEEVLPVPWQPETME